MPAANPQERSLIASIAADESWAATPDRANRTAPARKAAMERFEREVPDDITDPAERAIRAAYLRRAYFKRLSLKSAQARRKVRELTAEAEAAEAELDANGGAV